MPNKERNIPKRRFKEFENADAWELRKLGELMNENSERTSDFANNPLYSLTIENGITPKTERYERSSLVTKQEDLFKIVKPNEFVTNPMNLRFGALGYNSNSFRISVSGYYDVFSIDENRCSNYWYAFFKTDRALSILDNVSTGSLIEKRRVKYSTLRQISFRMPCELDEKIKIGNFFSTLDRHITLHQRKLDKLKSIKQAYLSEMFPAEGERVPKRRFPGFTDDWELRKLGEVASFKKGPFGSALKKEIFIPKSSTSVKVYEQQNAINKDWKLERYYISKDYAETLETFKVRGGDIIVSCAGTIGELYELPLDAEIGVINQALMRIRINKTIVDGKIFQILFSNMIDDFSQKHSNGSAMKNIPPFSDLKRTTVKIPSTAEQSAIGTFFSTLDQQITLHQRKLEKLKNLKKALLNELFV